jgi:hypothetical protein
MMLQAFNRQFDFGRYEISRVCYLSEHGRCGVTETKRGKKTQQNAVRRTNLKVHFGFYKSRCEQRRDISRSVDI